MTSWKLTALGLLSLLALAACSQTQVLPTLASPGGQLFCQFQLAGGGTIVAGLVSAEAAATGAAAPAAVLATGLAKNVVDDDCKAAMASVPGAVAATPTAPVVPVVPVTPAKP
jgi:hypothetical protein